MFAVSAERSGGMNYSPSTQVGTSHPRDILRGGTTRAFQPARNFAPVWGINSGGLRLSVSPSSQIIYTEFFTELLVI